MAKWDHLIEEMRKEHIEVDEVVEVAEVAEVLEEAEEMKGVVEETIEKVEFTTEVAGEVIKT